MDLEMRAGNRKAKHRLLLALAVVLASLARPDGALAQRGVQLVPDATQRLVSKDVGDERWAIALDVASGIVTGNVYRRDGGPPQYVWCVPRDGSRDPLGLRCNGTAGCDGWVELGDVELPASFFRPDACAATAREGAHVGSSAASAGRASDAPASGLRLTPDARRSLLAKDVGGLRWTMSYDHVARTMTGNVFDPAGGPPRFVSCRNQGGGHDVAFRCVGASVCECGGCRQTDWQPLADVTLPTSFFQARRCPATPAPAGLVATLEPSRAADAVDDSLVNEAFGASVAIAGDVLAAGSQEKAVYVYERGPGGWREAARIPPFEPYAGSLGTGRFGTKVAVSGGRVAILDNHAVRIVERGDGTWAQATTIAPPEPDARIGAISLSSDTLAFTVNFADSALPHRIEVHDARGGAWSKSATIALPGHDSYEIFGDVHVADGRLAILVLGNAVRAYGTLRNATIDVLERRGDAWRPVSSTAIPFSPLDRRFPQLALVGDELVVAQAPDEPLLRTPGDVRVLARAGTTWRETQRLTACSTDIGRFGGVIAQAGDTLVVGAPSFSGGGAAGEVHVFRRGACGWIATGRLHVGDAATDGLALDGSTLVVGATQLRASPGGALQVFDLDAVELLPPRPCAEDTPEVWPGADWQVEPPLEHGMNPYLLARAGEYALRPSSHTQGVVVARHGVVVAEWYESGRDATSYAASWSVAKSIAGALIGVAIERGDLPDEDVRLADFFPQWRGTPKDAITLRHALQMTTGISFGENHSTRPDNVSDIAYLASVARDHLSYVLDLPLNETPGSTYSYSSGDSMLLSGVIEVATGLSAGEYARRHLFGPLGMPRAQWWSDAVGHTLTYCCFDAPSRDFARIGLLYARDGRWNGRQILPARWVGDSAAAVGSAYQWYANGESMYAFGFDQQWIYVFPELDLVVVRNGHYDKDPGPPIADPNLFARYPAGGLVPGKGTIPPENWSTGPMLDMIREAIVAR